MNTPYGEYQVDQRSGLYVPERFAKQKQRQKAFSLFSGAGGFDLGMIQAGFEVVGGNEFDEYAALTYMVNLGSYPMQIHYIEGQKDKERLNKACEKMMFGHGKQKKELIQATTSGSGWIRQHPEAAPVRNFWFGNVRKLTGKMIMDALGIKRGELDCLFGGPPCQGYSAAGKQQIADPRNNLVYEFGRLIVELQPKTFVMEEVPAIVDFFDPDGVPVLDKFCLMISEGGYGNWEQLKKGMLMQAGCAAGIKSRKDVTKLAKKHTQKAFKVPQASKKDHDQISLFDEVAT